MLLRCNVNHRIPSASNTAVCGSRVAGRGVGHRIDGDLLGGRVELADRTVLVAGVPDHARVIDRDRVRHGVGRQRVFLHLASRRIDAPDQVAPLARPPDGAVRRLDRVAGALTERRHLPLGEPDLELAGDQRRRARRVRRHVGSQVPGNLRPLLRHVGQVDHVGEVLGPFLFGVARTTHDLFGTVAAGAQTLDQVLADAVGQVGLPRLRRSADRRENQHDCKRSYR